MARLLREVNLGHEGVLAQIAGVMAANESFYAGIHISCVAFLQDGKWRNGLCVARGIPNESGMPPARNRLVYPALKFLERQIASNELPALLDELKSKKLRFASDLIELAQNYPAFNSYELLPGENDYSAFPGYFYEGGRDSVAISQDPLIDYKSPFFASPYHAVRDWVGIRGFHLDRDARMGSFLLFLPECRARFDSLACSAAGLRIAVAPGESAALGLKVVGQLHTKNGSDMPLSESISDGGIEMSLKEPLDSLEIYLIGPDNTIYDHHREGAFHSTGHRRLLAKEETSEPIDALLQKAIASGESETVEFKPFIEIGHSKIDEVIETVIAFANTKGGTVLLGVNNHCGIEGIEKEIARAATRTSKSAEDALTEYIGALRQRIAGALNRTPAVTLSGQRSEGHLILALSVPEGPEKPYFGLRSKIAFLRRGANNVVADPERELPTLRSRESRFATLFGG